MHLGQALGSGGFARIVAIKRLHAHLASSPAAVAAFIDEARLSARVHHPNVVATLDVVEHERELFLVMDYVHGASVTSLMLAAKSADAKVPIAVAVAIAIDVLGGLQAIHEATSEDGKPLAIVHRDISPQNILVGGDGIARVVDFGVAKAAVRMQGSTGDGRIKGKLRYMAPEQLMNLDVDPRTDAFSAQVVLWELLTGAPLFDASNEGAIIARVLEGIVTPPSRMTPAISAELERVVMRGLSRNAAERFDSCRDLASALRAATAPATADEVSRWVSSLAGDQLRERAARVARIETGRRGEGPIAAAAAPEAPTMTASNAGATSAAPKRARARIAVVAAIALIAATFVAVALAGPWGKTQPSVSTADFRPSASTIAPVTTASVTTNTDAPSVASASASTATDPSSAPRGPIGALRAAPSKTAPAKPTSRPGCTPMFTVDENGIRRVKPECL